jgi:hypothetical protein
MSNLVNIIGVNGIFASSIHFEGKDHFTVELNGNAKTAIDYIEDFKNHSGMWDGRQAGEALQHLLEEVASIKSQLAQDEHYRINNPAVGAAWEQYQTMLELAREYGDRNNEA